MRWYSIHPNGNRNWQQNNIISANDGENIAISIGGRGVSSNIVKLSFNNIILNDNKNDYHKIITHDIQSKILQWNYPNMTIDSGTKWLSNNSIIEGWTSSASTSINGLAYITDSHYGNILEYRYAYSGMLIYDVSNNKYISPNLYEYSLIYLLQEGCVINNKTHLFVLGGYYMSGPNWDHRTESKYMQIYDTINDYWSLGKDLNEERKLCGCSFDRDDNFIYVFGG